MFDTKLHLYAAFQLKIKTEEVNFEALVARNMSKR